MLGDRHVLKNYQEVLMKIFWDARLKGIAKLAHKNMTLKSLVSCSNIQVPTFKFLDYRQGNDLDGVLTNDDFMQRVQTVLSHISIDNGKYSGMPYFLEAELQFVTYLPTFLKEFDTFCCEMSSKFNTLTLIKEKARYRRSEVSSIIYRMCSLCGVYEYCMSTRKLPHELRSDCQPGPTRNFGTLSEAETFELLFTDEILDEILDEIVLIINPQEL